MTTQQQTERDEALMRVAELAEELIQTGLRNDGHALCVIEKIDKSDPHYRLCAALDELRALRGDEPAKPDRYVEVAQDVLNAFHCKTKDEGEQAAAAVLRRHFEPSAEVIEAARLVKKNYSGGAYPHSITLADHILKGDQ